MTAPGFEPWPENPKPKTIPLGHMSLKINVSLINVNITRVTNKTKNVLTGIRTANLQNVIHCTIPLDHRAVEKCVTPVNINVSQVSTSRRKYMQQNCR